MLDLLVRVLPDVVREASAPLGNIERLTVISTDGASDLTRTVASNVSQGMQMASDLTGVDVAALVRNLGGMPASAAGNGHAPLVSVDGTS